MSPIDAKKLDEFTVREGEIVIHSTGVPCFCISEKGELDPNCREHDFTGHLYRNPQRITGLVTGITQHKVLIDSGIFLPGDVVFSPESGNIVTEGDKIQFTWPEPYGEGEILRRGQPDYENTYYEAVKALHCSDEKGNIYTQDVDFRFVGKKIEWRWAGKVGGTVPNLGIRYMLKYTAFLEWLAFDVPMERISHGNDMGTKVGMRKIHLQRPRA
jgi:hypothetical protein